MTKFPTVKTPLLLLIIGLFTALSLDAKDFPKLVEGQRVYDLAGVLSPEQKQALEYKIVAYQDSTSTQIVILTEPSLEGEDDFDYTYRLAEKWGIGQEEKNNGLLIAAFMDEHKLRIQVGRGLEPAVTDAISHYIIEEDLKPAFRQGNYYAGFNKALDDVFAAAKGEFKGNGKHPGKRNTGIAFLIPLIAIILIILLSRRGGGGFGGGMMTGYMLGRMGGGGWGNFSSGSGGFGGGGGFSGGGGFGGGSFGGGGSGGGW
ncbi:MAG: TPM domain-containing protein [Bacteroidetes bacterium]|nr:TPM domain-containing protein [Bacteroidota bacterium]